VRLANRSGVVIGVRVDAGPALRAHIRERVHRLLVNGERTGWAWDGEWATWFLNLRER
jgi:hypothetical protein